MQPKPLDHLLPALLAGLCLLSLIACTCGGSADEPAHPDDPGAHDAPDAARDRAVEPIGASGRKATVEAAFKKLYEDKGVVVRAATCEDGAKSADRFSCELDQAHGPVLRLDATLKDGQLDFKPADGEPAALSLDELNQAIPDKIKADTGAEGAASCGRGVAFFPVGHTFSCALTLKDGPEQRVSVVVKDAEGNISWSTQGPPTPAAQGR